jgi:hypothetical protein
MKRNLLLMAVCLLTVLSFVTVLGCSSDSGDGNKKFSHLLKGAFLEQPAGENHPPILHIEGSHYEMGFQQGYLLADRIAEVYSSFFTFTAYLYQIHKGEEMVVLDQTQLKAFYELLIQQSKKYFLSVIQDKAPELLEEIQGMADGLAAKGSSFGFDDIIAMAALVDVADNQNILFYDFFELPRNEVETPISGMGCSGFAAWGSATFDGRIIHGANQDLPSYGILDQTIVIVAKPDTGNAFLQISFPGWFTMSGMNEAGISTNEMASPSSDTNLMENPEIPHTLHMRMIVQYANNLEEAKETIQIYGGASGWNILVSDSNTREAVDIECSTLKIGPVYPWDNPSTSSVDEAQGLCVTNQYMSCPEFRGYSGENLTLDQMKYYGVDTSSWGMGNEYKVNWEAQFQKETFELSESWDRWSRLWDLYASKYETITVEEVIAFMSDTKEGPHGGIISHSSPEIKWFDGDPVPQINGPDKAITFYSLASMYSCVFDPESSTNGVIWIAAAGAKPAQKGQFYSIDFGEALNRTKQ